MTRGDHSLLWTAGYLLILTGRGIVRCAGVRIVARLAYLGAGIGASFAIRDVFAARAVRAWWFFAILAVDIAVAVVLFACLRGPSCRRNAA